MRPPPGSLRDPGPAGTPPPPPQAQARAPQSPPPASPRALGRSPPPRSPRRPGPTPVLRPAAGPGEAVSGAGEAAEGGGGEAHLSGAPQGESRPAAAPALTSQLNSISASMVAMRTVKVLGCFLFSELKLMRDAMAPAMAGEAAQRGGSAMAAGRARAPAAPGRAELRPPPPPRHWSRAGLIPPSP